MPSVFKGNASRVLLMLSVSVFGACAQSPEVALDSSNPLRGMGEVTAVATGFISTEGPVWHQASGSLIFSDIPGDTIYSLDTETGALSRLRDPSSNANGLALDASGGLLAAEQLTRSITRMNLDTGEVTSFIAALNVGGQERRFNSPNDMTIHNNGGVYFTDPPFGLRGREDQRELDFNGVFLRRPGGAIELIKALGVDENPNGIILNPDQTVLYLAVSHDVSGPILAFDVDADGNLSNEREFARAQNSDGMAIDTDGNLYVATRTAVQVYAPDGSEWGRIRLPGNLRTTNVAFGGQGMSTLYITNRSENLYALELNARGLN